MMVDQLRGLDFLQRFSQLTNQFSKPSQNPQLEKPQTNLKVEKVSQKRLLRARPVGLEFPVNTYVTNDQEDPATAALRSGNFVTVWAGEGKGDIDGIFGQIFNPDSSKNGTEFLVNNYTNSYQVHPAVTGLENGGFVTVWYTPFKDGNGFGVFGQVFYPNGTKNRSEFQGNSYTPSDQKMPAIASTIDNFVVTWESPQDGSGIGIRGRLFYPNATNIAGEFPVNTYTSDYQDNSAVAGSNNGDFLVVYESGNPAKIRGQVFNPTSSKKGVERVISTSQIEEQLKPAAAALDNGKYIVAWHTQQDGSGYGIFAQIINADGTKSGGEIPVNTITAGSQMDPSAAGLTDGKFVITWTNGTDIVGQIFNSDGSKIGSEFPVNSHTSGAQVDSSVAHLGNDRFVVTWESQNQDTSLYGIFGQIFELSNATTSTSSSSSTTSLSSSSTQVVSSSSSSSSNSPILATTTTISSSSLSTTSTQSLFTEPLTAFSSSSSLSTRNIQPFSDSDNQQTSSLNNTGLITGITLGIIAGLASICLLSFLYYRHRKSNHSIPVDGNQDHSAASFELNAVLIREQIEIGGEYVLLKKIDVAEAETIYQQTGYLIIVPFGKNSVKHVIGRGTFGKIRLGKRKSDGEYVAVKKVKGKKEMLASEKEAEIQRKAQGENVLPIYNTVKFENELYHFMPLAALGSGESIQEQLSSLNSPKLSQELIKFVAKDVLTGLQTIHSKKISHLDIKSSNIVFMKDGTAMITDFGCAKETKLSPNVLGDKTHFSPERIASLKGGVFDTQKADMWAAGVMLLLMYKNKSPQELFGFSIDHLDEFTPAMFQEKLDQIEELQSPSEGSIWWVIKHLLDVNEETRLSAEQALTSACFKGLLPSMKSTIFQKLRSRHLIKDTSEERDIDMQNYGFVAKLQTLKEQGETEEMQELIDRYVTTGHYQLTPEAHYALTPDFV